MKSRLLSVMTTALAAALMLGAFTLVGGFGDLQIGSVEASPDTSITNISVSGTCGTAGGFTGTVTLSGTFTGTVQLGLFSHVPGGQFTDTGQRANAVFNGGSTATYNFAPFTVFGANSYRIQVIDGAGLGGDTTKSNSVNPCTGGPSTTTTTKSTTTSVSVTTTAPSTTTTTTVGTTTGGTTTVGTTTVGTTT